MNFPTLRDSENVFKNKLKDDHFSLFYMYITKSCLKKSFIKYLFPVIGNS